MIKLPPLPLHPDPHTYQWSQREIDAIRTAQREAMRAALEAAAKVCESQDDVGSVNQQWMRERCAFAIRALRIEGETT
jgi:hypothetical protein